MGDELNRLLLRKVAVKWNLDERTLKKALAGGSIRTADVADRARQAVEEYRAGAAAPASAPPKGETSS